MNIGEKIKRIRQHRRMTQKELGELVDLSANRIAQYEMGYRVPKKPLLNQIAGASVCQRILPQKPSQPRRLLV